jgi:hypothetical protein
MTRWQRLGCLLMVGSALLTLLIAAVIWQALTVG